MHATRLAATLVLAGAAGLTACSHRQATISSYERPNTHDTRFENVLVVALHADPDVRTELERRVASDLRRFDIDATPGSQVSIDLTRPYSTDFERWLRASDQDGVITITPYEVAQQFDPNDWDIVRTNDFRRTFGLKNATTEYLENTGVEVTVWSTENWRAVWGARSEAFGREADAKDISRFIIANVRENDVFAD